MSRFFLSHSGALGLHRAPPDKGREEASRQFTESCVMSNRIGDKGLEASVHSKGKVTVKRQEDGQQERNKGSRGS